MKLEWKQILAAFFMGIVLGAFFILRCPFGPHGAWGNPEKFHHHMMDQFTSKLKLSADQQQKVSAILEESRSKIDTLRQDVHPRLEEIRSSSRARIREVLMPEQQKKFDVMTAEMNARFEKRHAEHREKGGF